MIIHLNGMPGVGKLTVATLLAYRWSARLVDNHSLINAATVCCEHGSPTYIATLARITHIVYDVLSSAPRDEIFIFTNALASEAPEDRARYHAVEALAHRKQVPFIPVLLTCALAENQRRLVSQEREAKRKLRQPEQLAKLYECYTIYHPSGADASGLALDTTNQQPAAIAEQIAAHVQAVVPAHVKP